MTDDQRPHADAARGQEGLEKWAPQNGLPNVKVGSHPSNPLRHRGVGSWKRWTKRVPIATLPVWAFRGKRLFSRVSTFYFFWFFSVTMSMRKPLTAFSSEKGCKGGSGRVCTLSCGAVADGRLPPRWMAYYPPWSCWRW